jgi:DNA-binding LacI/PurR family transcriptional regulator
MTLGKGASETTRDDVKTSRGLYPSPTARIASNGARKASFELVSMLLDLGHTRIGHLTGPSIQSGSIARLQGYRDALQARGIVIDQSSSRKAHSGFRKA